MGRRKVVTWVTANEMETRLIVATRQGRQLWHGCHYDGKGRRNDTVPQDTESGYRFIGVEADGIVYI